MFSLAVPATFVSIEATAPHRHQHTSDQIRVTYVLILNVSPKSQRVPSETHVLSHHPQYQVLASQILLHFTCTTSLLNKCVRSLVNSKKIGKCEVNYPQNKIFSQEKTRLQIAQSLHLRSATFRQDVRDKKQPLPKQLLR